MITILFFLVLARYGVFTFWHLQFHYLNLVKKLSEGKWYPFPVTEESGFIMVAVLAFD
jgi:hypothetical protein